jgi:hypothetical protein
MDTKKEVSERLTEVNWELKVTKRQIAVMERRRKRILLLFACLYKVQNQTMNVDRVPKEDVPNAKLEDSMSTNMFNVYHTIETKCLVDAGHSLNKVEKILDEKISLVEKLSELKNELLCQT